MNWLPINEIDGQIGDGERIVVLMNTPEGWPWLCIFQAMAIGDSVSFVCTEDSPSLLCDGKGWLPEGAVAKHLSGEILDDSDGIPVCADCMNEPCQCEITPPSDGVTSIESSLAGALEKILAFGLYPPRIEYAQKAEWIAAQKQARAALAMRQAGGKEGGGE